MAAAACALATYTGLAAGSEQTTPSRDSSIELGLRAQSLTFVRGGRDILLVSNEDRRLALLDLDTGRTVKELAYADLAPDRRLGSVVFTDVAVAPEPPFVYLVGQVSAERRAGVIARLDMRSFKAEVMGLDDPLPSPSVAVAQSDLLVVGDRESSTLRVIEGFETLASSQQRQSDLGRRIYLKYGPVNDIGVSLDGRFILVSHAYGSSVSLVDTKIAQVVDTYGGRQGRLPLSMTVARSAKGARGEPVANVVIASREENYLAVAEVNPQFQAFDRTPVASLGFAGSTGVKGPGSPLLVAASDALETIVVGSRTENAVEILRRVPGEGGATRGVSPGRSAGGLERANIVRLDGAVADIALSPDGQVLIILLADGRSARVVRNPVAWSGAAGIIAGSDSIREAQRLLVALGYPIGTVDGLDGPRTRDAVLAFKESTRLGRDRTLDEQTLQRMRQVVQEMPQPSEAHLLSAGSDRARCRPIDPKELCTSRRGPFEPLKNHPDRETEEIICASVDPDPLVQIDRFSRSGPAPTYQCSGFHSCAFVRYRDVVAYDRVCRKVAKR